MRSDTVLQQARQSAASNQASEPPKKEEDMDTTVSTAAKARVPNSEHETSEPEFHDAAEVLKVSTRSRPSAVAGAIAGVIRESGLAEVQSIGAGATNQAIKAIAIARSYLNEEGIDIICVPSFIDVSIDNEERTAIRMLIERR
jgi:stage V sporulation protein S